MSEQERVELALAARLMYTDRRARCACTDGTMRKEEDDEEKKRRKKIKLLTTHVLHRSFLRMFCLAPIRDLGFREP